MSLKTVSVCRTLFYLSIVCVKTFFPFEIFPIWDLMCNWVASAEKSRCPAVPLLPSGLKPLRGETRAPPPFSPSRRRRGRPRCSCSPSRGASLKCHGRGEVTSPPPRKGDLPAPGDAAQVVPPLWICNGMDRGRKGEISAKTLPSLVFCFVSLKSLMALFPK